MIVKSIELVNYRNYDSLSVSFDENTNIFYGKNAQGKTNLIEAIYMCATSRSHRGNKDRDIIQIDKEEAHIKIIVEKNNVPFRIDMHLKKNKSKGIAINGIQIKKASELFGILNVVVFSPEDLDIIKRGPAERRRFIDLEICQIDKIYVNNLINYNKILQNRNRLLKDLNNKKELYETLEIWDMQLFEYGKELIKRRREYINQINFIINDIHKSITDNKENLEIKYEPCIDENLFYEEIIKNREKDIKLKATNIGPHRDDISFYVMNKNMKIYGSQGQQRTCALSLKLSEISLIKSIIKENPVLLLDDVLSELDNDRQEKLINSLGDIQTFITCTGLDEFIDKKLKINTLYKIENGKIVSNSVIDAEGAKNE